MKLVAQRYAGARILVSRTARPPRPGEMDGVDYHFVSQDAFQDAIDAGEFLEYSENHHAYFYGTKKVDVEHIIAGDTIVVKDMNIQGIQLLQENAPDIFSQAVRIFLDISDLMIRERILSRGPVAEEEISRRQMSAVMERGLAASLCTDIVDASPVVEVVYAAVSAIIDRHLATAHSSST